MNKQVAGALLVWSILFQTVLGKIDFGSKDSGFTLVGGSFNPGDAPYQGTIRILGDSTLTTSNLQLEDGVIEVVKKESAGTVSFSMKGSDSNNTFIFTADTISAPLVVTYAGLTSTASSEVKAISEGQEQLLTLEGTHSFTLSSHDSLAFTIGSADTLTLTFPITTTSVTAHITVGASLAPIVTSAAGHIRYVYNNEQECSLSAQSAQALVVKNNDVIHFIARTVAEAERFYGRLTGSYTPGGLIKLGNNDVLHLEGGETVGSVMVSAEELTPATIEGNGQFSGQVLLDGTTSNACLCLGLQGIMNQDITFSGNGSTTTKLLLAHDLYFADGKECKKEGEAVPLIDMGGCSIHFGGKVLTTSTPLYFSDTSSLTPSIELHEKVNLNAAWTTYNDLVVSGKGNILHFGENTGQIVLDNHALFMTDITLENAKQGCIVQSAIEPRPLSFSNVVIIDGNNNGAIRCTPTSQETQAQPMNVSFAGTSGGTVGDFFAQPITWSSGGVIEALGDLTLHTTWTIEKDMIINANGNSIDLRKGKASGLPGVLSLVALDGGATTLRICDAVIKIDDAASLRLPANTVLDLRNCTITMVHEQSSENKNIDLSDQAGALTLSGESLFVTGPYIFTAPAGQCVVTDGMVWYDTLGHIDVQQLQGMVGSIAPAPFSHKATITYTSTLNQLAKTEFLSPLSTASTGGSESEIQTIRPQVAHFSAGEYLFCGHNRSFVFANTPAVMMRFETGALVTIKDTVLEGMRSSNLLIEEGAQLRWGDNTHIRLQSDDTLDKAYYIAAGASVVLDLKGHTLDMAHAGIILAQGATLTLKNGSLTGFAGGGVQLSPEATSATIKWENVNLVLNTDYTPDPGLTVFFCGHSHLYSHTDEEGEGYAYSIATQHTITHNARFVIEKGAQLQFNVPLAHPVAEYDSVRQLRFADPSAVLEVNGSSLQLNTTTLFETGIFRVHDRVYIKTDTAALLQLYAGSTLKLDFSAGATAQVMNGVTIHYLE